MIRLRVNGLEREVEADPEMPLLWVLRDVLGLTGTKFGCGAGLCGACAVHVDGEVAWSCTVTLADSAGRAVTTIEGLHPRGDHPVQAAWLKHDVVQCGYCHPGMVMTVAGLLDGPDRPSLAELEARIGNICRCGTYPRIRRALRDLVEA